MQLLCDKKHFFSWIYLTEKKMEKAKLPIQELEFVIFFCTFFMYIIRIWPLADWTTQLLGIHVFHNFVACVICKCSFDYRLVTKLIRINKGKHDIPDSPMFLSDYKGWLHMLQPRCVCLAACLHVGSLPAHGAGRGGDASWTARSRHLVVLGHA